MAVPEEAQWPSAGTSRGRPWGSRLAARGTIAVTIDSFAGEGGFARFNGTAPLPASSAEGDGQPVRHRLNRGGNRRVNAVLHRMAVTQLRCDERAQTIFNDARKHGHTKKEAMRVLKRQLSNVVYRRMMFDLKRSIAVNKTHHQAA